MSASHGLDHQSRSWRRTHRFVVVLLALPLSGVLATAAPVGPAVAYTEPASGRVSTAVGGLSHASGAGARTWGLRRHAAWSTRVIKHRYAIRTVHGYRSSSTSDHGDRLAADFMLRSNVKGHRVSRFARRHFRQLNITYVIWNQRIWSRERAREGWRRMADAGSATANHKDHVHVSFRRNPTNRTYRG